MKLIIVFCLMATSAMSDPSAANEECFQGIIEMLPFDLIRNVSEHHLKNDTGYQAAVKYFQGAEWKEITENLKALKPWQEVKTYLKALGINIDMFVDHFFTCVSAINTTGIDGGVKPNLTSFLDDVRRLQLEESVIQKMMEKIKQPNFKECIAKLQSEELHVLMNNVLAAPEMEKFLAVLEGMGVPAKLAIKVVYDFARWDYPSH